MQESTGQQYDNKTGQWFGSLVTSSGDDGVVLVGHKDETFLCWYDFCPFPDGGGDLSIKSLKKCSATFYNT